MFLFGKKKKDQPETRPPQLAKTEPDQPAGKPLPAAKEQPAAKVQQSAKEEHVICRSCFVDFTVSRVEQAGGKCPSCGAKIDLSTLPRGTL